MNEMRKNIVFNIRNKYVKRATLTRIRWAAAREPTHDVTQPILNCSYIWLNYRNKNLEPAT